MTRVAVVGAGIAGLVAALRLAEGGARVTVVAAGSGGAPLSPGTIDVLGYGPGRLDDHRAGVADLVAARPDHPYARTGPQEVVASLAWLRDRLAPLRLVGETGRNMLLPTALGVARPTALAPAAMAAGALRPGARVLAVGLRPLKDVHPRMLAENLERAPLGGAPVRARHVTLDVSPRPGRADVATPVYARAMDDDAGFRAALGDALRAVREPDETVLLPAVLGLRRAAEVWEEVQDRAEGPVAEVATVPPSVPGMRLGAALVDALLEHRVRVTYGPQAVGCDVEGGRIAALRVRDAARTRSLPVDAVVLATGGIATGAIARDSHGALRETALGLPVAGPAPGDAGLSPRHLDEHPLMRAGLAVDGHMRPVGADGAPAWANLHAAGAVVAGALAWREKSGEGIAVATAHRAARAILEER